MPKKKSHIVVHRVPFMALDSRFQVKHKWLFDIFAGPNEGYTGYVTAWDTIPWQTVVLDDGMPHDFNYAAQSQFIPKYAGDVLGTRDDMIALLETDGIADAIIKASYSIEGAGTMKAVPLRYLFSRNFDPAIIACPVVFCRPMTYKKGAPGHIGDNGQQAFFVKAADSCDGTEGLRITLAPDTYRHEFWADSMHFLRTVPAEEITAETAETAEKETTGTGSASSASSAVKYPSSARLVVYCIACGSVPRISINGTWFVVSPTYFPPYGDPYGYCHKGHKHLVGTIAECGLRLAAGESNDFIIEHIAPLGENCGAQVIFAIEYDETIIEPTHGRKGMALTEDQKRAFVRRILEVLTDYTADLTAAGFNTAARVAELQALAQVSEQKEQAQVRAREAHLRATAESKSALKGAYDNASSSVELIVGLLGKSHPLIKILKNIRDEMGKEPKKKPATP